MCGRRRNAPVRHTWLSLSNRAAPADELSPATLDAVHAGCRVCRAGAHPHRIRACDRAALSLLQLRRRDAAGAAGLSAGFELLATDGAARRARLHLNHGVVETPVVMPVVTYSTVKAMTPEELQDLGSQIVLGNTFHLWLRPGTDVIAAHGGLHRFMGWERPLLTDSGGFQVFSLAQTRKIDADGVTFRSLYDGTLARFTPEVAMAVQASLGSDIAMAFDECAPAAAARAD